MRISDWSSDVCSSDLRVREAGTAEILDSDGNTLAYDSEDSARAALLEAEYVEYDGLDPEDAQARGFALEQVRPPQGESDEALRRQMFVRLGGPRSEEQTSELQSLMSSSYDVL